MKRARYLGWIVALLFFPFFPRSILPLQEKLKKSVWSVYTQASTQSLYDCLQLIGMWWLVGLRLVDCFWVRTKVLPSIKDSLVIIAEHTVGLYLCGGSFSGHYISEFPDLSTDIWTWVSGCLSVCLLIHACICISVYQWLYVLLGAHDMKVLSERYILNGINLVVWMRNVPHKLRYLNTWPPVGGTAFSRMSYYLPVPTVS